MLGHRSLNLEDYVSILKRRWWIIAIPAMIAPMIAVGVTFLLPATYQSQSLVLIDQQKVASSFVQSVVSEDLNNRLASMQQQILSRSSLEPIVTKYNLYASEHLSMDARVDKARKLIVVEAIQSDLARANGLPGFRIFFTANDPHTAQQVCQEITSLFTGENLRLREAAAEGTTDFLKEQIDQAKQTLDDQDDKLAAFQSQHPGNLPGDEGTNESLLNTLNTQLESTTQQIQQMEQNQSVMETMLAQQSQPTASANAALTPQAEQTELDTLMNQRDDLTTRYTADYPGVKSINRKIADLQAQMAKEANAPPVAPVAPTATRPDPVPVQALRAQLSGLRLAIQDKRKVQDQITQQIRSYQGRIESSPQVEAQYKALTRDSDTAHSFYNGLQAKLEQATMESDLEHRQQGETFSLLDAANFPDTPTFPKPSVFAMGGLGAGMFLGLLIVAILEFKDTALRTERDVWAFTQLPTLAVIAWSGDLVDSGRGGLFGLRRIFRRKSPKKLIVETPG